MILFNKTRIRIQTYGTFSVFIGLLVYSIFISNKREILSDHVEFLNDQIPRLKEENVALFSELKKVKKYSKSANIRINNFSPFVEFLFENRNEFPIHKLETVNEYLIEHFDTPDLLQKNRYEKLSLPVQEILAEYRYVQFQNSLINYLANKVGSYSGISMNQQFKIIDFWSKDRYEIHLNYIPDFFYETSMKIKGKLRNDNAILFGPQRTGLHTIDISLSQYDEKGNEKKLNFKKKIMVLP